MSFAVLHDLGELTISECENISVKNAFVPLMKQTKAISNFTTDSKSIMHECRICSKLFSKKKKKNYIDTSNLNFTQIYCICVNMLERIEMIYSLTLVNVYSWINIDVLIV